MPDSEIPENPGAGLSFPLPKYLRVVKVSLSDLCNKQGVGGEVGVGKEPRAFVVLKSLSGGVGEEQVTSPWPLQTCFPREGEAMGG